MGWPRFFAGVSSMGSAVASPRGESFGSCVDRNEGRNDDAEFKIDAGDTA
jgi:hypothetical protein